MKIILAGPGTGKTTKIKALIRSQYAHATNILVLSFTNATINDLKKSFEDVPTVHCYTLHSYALKINHLPALYVLDDIAEVPIIEKYVKKINITFNDFCGILNCIRFEGMIKQCTTFIKNNPVYAAENIGSFDLLIVDEFQDFNEVERELVYLLSNYASDTLILGDDDQSIYDFKDADPDGIISLYKDTKIEKIPHDNICYRCPDAIVDYGSKLIKRNLRRVEKEWRKSNKDGQVVFMQKLTQNETHEYTCSEITKIRSYDPSASILILSPVGFYIANLKEKLSSKKIEYIDFWMTRISPEIRKKIWLFKALYGDHKILFLLLLAYALGLHTKKRFVVLLESSFRQGYEEEVLLRQMIRFFSKPYSDYLQEMISVQEFLEKYPEFRDLSEYIDKENLVDSVKQLEKIINPSLLFKSDMVNIMSIHKSKGLQADYVFILGLNEGVIPNETRGIDTIEAQRRLFFVGMTRVLKKIYMISTIEWEGKFVNKLDKTQFKYKYWKKAYYGKASRFISEMQ